jgi:hypothetical protein
MSGTRAFDSIREGLAEIPLLDVHTHLDAAHLAARGLDDVLLYHMVVSELSSAGCPSRARVSEDRDDEEARARTAEALPFVPFIRNTSCGWGLRVILRDLYGTELPEDEAGWWRLHERIVERSTDAAWSREVLRRAGIRRACTELWRGRDGSADDVFQYALEWAFFARRQSGMEDVVVYELERTWSQDVPEPPLPVTMAGRRPAVPRPIRSVDDVHAAVDHYVATIPFDRIVSTAQHLSTHIDFEPVSEERMTAALERRESAGAAEREAYAGYILEAFVGALERLPEPPLLQLSVGGEPLPFETGSTLRQETVFQVADLVARHPGVRFQFFLASEHANQSFCTLARELPNISLAGYWWHNLFPGIIRKVLRDRLDMLPLNRHIAFFSDAYCVEWSYAKAVIIRAQVADVLAEKVEQGQYSIDDARSIARQVLYETPQTLNGMQPGSW